MSRLKIREKKRHWLSGLVVLVVLGLIALLVVRSWPNTEEPSATVPLADAPSQPSISFAAMGDMLAHDSVVTQARTSNGYDFTPYFATIKPLYESSDVVFCNPETPAAGARFGISGYPTFNAPNEFARDLRSAGCNVINLATNHIADKGQEALEVTLDEWDKLDTLAVAGANRSQQEQDTISYFEKNGLKVAFLAFADFSNGTPAHDYTVNFYHDTELVERLVRRARSEADVVLVSMHWGVEDSHEVSDEQRSVAQTVADLGADVIIGTGPHVLQPVDWLERSGGGRTLVWYSLGNMLSSQLQVDQLTGGVAKFTITKSGDDVTFSDIALDGTFMSYEWSAADRTASRLEARRNLKLQPLAGAQSEVRLFDMSVEERAQKLREWLGGSVEVKISP